MTIGSRATIRRRRVARAALAFSLIEVLLAIVILALGLLGLGAVIPVVIRQQRIANETTLGVSAANNAESILRGRTDLRTPQTNTSGNQQAISPWRAWRDDTTDGGLSENGTSSGSNNRTGLWCVPEFDRATGLVSLRLDSSRVNFNLPAPQQDRFSIPLSQRLVPAPEPGGPPPRFVWDFVARRVVQIDRLGNPLPVDPSAASSDPIQVAVFVRRIDPSIRLPGGVSLARALVDSNRLAEGSRRTPVAVDEQGRPRLNGVIGPEENAGYGLPIVLEPGELSAGVGPTANYEPANSPTPSRRDDRDRLTFRRSLGPGSQLPPGTDRDTAVALASQINQLLVDGFGNVYRVIGRDADQLIIDPPVPAWVRRPEDLKSIAFVPQVAAEVRVFTINPE